MRFPFTKITMVVLALGIAACSATPVRRSFKESWKDTMTAEKVRYKLMRDKEVKKSRMHVEVFRGQVTLTGRAVTEAEKVRAETLAKSVKRVTGVENYVHVVGDGKPASAKAAGTVIEEKTIVVEKEKIRTSADDIPATVPTVRVGTGTGQSVTTVVTPARKPAALKAATKSTKSAKPAAKETQLATVKKVPDPATKAKIQAPVAPAAIQSTVPATRVVGQSKTGLPWDGEVYEDDASRIEGPAKAATAARTPAAASPPAPAPDLNTAPSSGDDLAKEAAQELEKLRQKK